ncbi:MAG: hypothetical protein IJC48_03415 [Clostridia bacterium]|nr:hypothetical protein [Clostridia bacterium]MBQ4157548.1 hypothetical protein [Clostridia bacterium]
MIKNRTAQLILQSVFIALGLISVLASFGLFTIEEGFHTDWYVHFTNLSNYLCIGIIFCELIQTIKKKEDGFVTAVPRLSLSVFL